MKKRISVFIFILSMMVCMFGSVSVYANEPDYPWGVQGDRPDYKNEEGKIVGAYFTPSYNLNVFGADIFTAYVYNVDRIQSGMLYVYAPNISTSVMEVEVPYHSNAVYYDGSYVGGTVVIEQDFDRRSAVSALGNNYYFYSRSYSDPAVKAIKPYGFDIVVTLGGDDFFNFGDAIEKYVYGGNVEVEGNVSFGGEFDESTATYQKELGYLQNVQFKSLYLKFWDEILNKFSTNPDSGKYQISWGSVSTSGLNLNDENVYVRMYSQCAIYNKEHENICNGFPMNFIQQYSASSGSLSIDIPDFLSYSQAQFDEVYNSMSKTQWIFNDYKRCDNIYLQIIRKNEDNTWSYGGYLKLSNNSDGSVSGHPVAPDGGLDIDSGGKQPVDSSTGIGDSYEDAMDNANQNIQSGASDDLLKNAESLVSQIGQIPQLVAIMFSFLPPWCLSIFGVGFGIIVLLIIYKLVRG